MLLGNWLFLDPGVNESLMVLAGRVSCALPAGVVLVGVCGLVLLVVGADGGVC